jgi:hypothetical protein
VEKLYNKIKKLLEDHDAGRFDVVSESKKAKNMANKFSKENRFKNIQEII